MIMRIVLLLRNEGSSPGWNGFYGRFTGLEWILPEIHRAGMDFTGDSPDWNDFHRKYWLI
jgi:hypothetical protein